MSAFTVCDVCDERVYEDNTVQQGHVEVCPECAKLTYEEQCAKVQRWRECYYAARNHNNETKENECPAAPSKN